MHRPTTLALALALATLLACTSGSDDQTATPTPEATPTAEAPPTATVSPTGPVEVATLDLPDGCHLFDEGWTERPVHAGEPTLISLSPTACAARALEDLAATALGVEWIALGFDADVVAARLRPNPDNGRWEATVTFPAPGRWVADRRVGIGDTYEVFTAGPILAAPASTLPLPAAPKTIAVLDGAATEVLRTFEGDFGGIGLLRYPDRVLYIGTRDGDTWLLAGDVATGEVEALLRVGRFPHVVAAPDGSAVVVQTRDAAGRFRVHLLTAEGRLVEIDERALNGYAISWAPDSRTLTISGDSFWVLAPDGSVRLREPLAEGERHSPVWAPDAAYLLVHDGDYYRRLDPLSLDEERLASASDVPVQTITFDPDFERVAVTWRDDLALNVSVLPVDEFLGPSSAPRGIEDGVVATFQQPENAISGFGAVQWSPDGRRLALVTPHTLEGVDQLPGGTAIWTIEAGTGATRRVAVTPDFYATHRDTPRWSADSATLYALRYDCTGCEPGSSAVDVIDVATGRTIATHDPAGLLGLTADGDAVLLTTPQGLLRTNGRATEVLYDAFRGGLTFGPDAAVLADPSGPPLIAVQLGVGHGVQLLAARPDGTDRSTLAVLAFGAAPVALLDPATLVLRGGDGWIRRHLASAVDEPYPITSDALEKYDFTVSPSGRLAVDRDAEGFAILDATSPPTPPIVDRRPYPGDVRGIPAWSPDERHLAFHDTGAISVLDLATGDDQRFDAVSLPALAALGLRENLWSITWTPTGDLLFAASSALWLIDLDANTATKVAPAPDPGGFTQGAVLAFSPDGRTLVAATGFGVFALDAAALTSEGTLTWRQLTDLGVDAFGGALHWSPDSTAVALTAVSGGYNPEGILVVPLDGSGAYRFVAPGAVTLLDWLPDGRIIWTTTTGGL